MDEPPRSSPHVPVNALTGTFIFRKLGNQFLATLASGAYIGCMLWRVRSSRGRPLNAPAAFIHPYRESGHRVARLIGRNLKHLTA
jgi:hypothetical protein